VKDVTEIVVHVTFMHSLSWHAQCCHLIH